MTSALEPVMDTSELNVGIAVVLSRFPLASTRGGCSSSFPSAVGSLAVIVIDAGSDVRCKKVPEDALVARRVQVPTAMGVMTPAPFIEHFAGVVVEKEKTPSPEPPVAVAVAL
ncbi:MAG: hypothetical protein EBT44_04995 [Actinobacteria bacterium]|uniref:Uncharacterized protein n=1 Tax=Candidatus Fonsibacter lacus TaxID=2576439 RepID=A0A965GEI8_9PROT|nr:hypothetical protein [Candidatus Fonsibacter lacus]